MQSLTTEFLHEERFPPIKLNRIYTDEGRRYTLPNSDLEYESVTNALGKLPGKKEGLMEWRRRVGEEEANRVSRTAASRGTSLHHIIEDYLNNKGIQTEGHMPMPVSLFFSMKDMIDASIQKVFALEQSLYSDQYRLAGTVDCIAQVMNRLTVIDFKSSTKPKERKWITDYFLQAAAYSFMVEEMYGQTVESNIIMIGVENSNPQIFVSDPYKYKTDPFFLDRTK